MPAISLPSRLGFSSPRSVRDRLFPGALVVAALLMGSGVGQPLEVGEIVTGFGQFEPALDSVTRPSMHRGESGEGVDLLVSVDHLVMGGAEPVEVSSNSPVFQVSGLVLDDGESGGRASDKLDQPVGERGDWLVGMVNSSVYVDD